MSSLNLLIAQVLHLCILYFLYFLGDEFGV